MTSKFDRFWDETLAKFQRREQLILTPEELEKEIAELKPEPLSEEEVGAIVEAVSSGDAPPSSGVSPDLSWIDEIDTSSVEEGVLQLNRNRGESDDEFEERLEQLRRRVLKENDDDEEDV